MKFIKQYSFLIASAAILLCTTIYWSLLSADIQQYNADQLADPALFKDWTTFNQSIFPSQHTFLLKWPIFYAIQLAGATPAAYVSATVITSLMTIGLFCLLLSRIEKRPVMLGLLLLALSTVLLLIPIEPKPGSLLPVGMGMITTRNIEYIVFLGAIALFIKDVSDKLITRRTVGATIILVFLCTTDQLFTGLAIGGALLVLLCSYILRDMQLRRTALKILVGSVVAAMITVAIILTLRKTGLLDTPAAAVGPYGFNVSLKDIALGLVYGGMGLLSLFGANPISQTVIVGDIPSALWRSVWSVSSIGYLINFGIVVASNIGLIQLIRRSINVASKSAKASDRKIIHYCLIVVSCALSSIGLFLITKHYYAVDARYMGMAFFAGFIVLAWFMSTITLPRKTTIAISAVLLVGCLVGTIGARQVYDQSQQAYALTAEQNNLVARALEHHGVKTLVGDYWRVYPIVSNTKRDIVPLPLEGCFEPRNVLISKSWQENAYTHSFAYLLTTEKTETGYPSCELSAVRKEFGSPSDTLVVEGTAKHPKTMLLFYDNGKNFIKPEVQIRLDDTSLLRNLNDLKDVSCSTGRTVVQTIAHQDDDILFMNPDLLRGVKQGECVRTIYFTAGDAGADQAYWLSREEGAKAGYAALLGVAKPVWRSRDVQLSNHHQVKIAQLQINSKSRASLIFMRLPDGNVTGRGFKADHMESLQKIIDGNQSTISSVDTTSTYTKAELLTSLQQFIAHYEPAVIRTQATTDHSRKFHDHSDHIAVGTMTQEAFEVYRQSHPNTTITHYIGYPIRDRPSNIDGEELRLKKYLFFTYAGHDPSTCTSDIECEKTSYQYFLSRQYTE